MTPDNPISPAPSAQLQSETDHIWTAADVKLAPGLYIIATPIGNLRDITLRALDILTQADHILAEDTRQSAKLLNHYNIKTSLSAYHDHNAAKRVPKLIERLVAGESLALVSDAGTPLVSDPGYKLVRAALDAGQAVFPVPGASSVLAALTLSGLPSDCFSFGGFLPPKTTARKKALSDYIDHAGTIIFFETAARLTASLKDIQSVLGEREMALTRELTKRYEEARYGTVSDVIESVKTTPPRGEIVLCIGPPDSKQIWPAQEVKAALPDVVAAQGVKRASDYIANISGWAKRDVYKIALGLKDKPHGE